MLGTVILGILAGVGAPYAEPHVKKALENVLLSDVPITPMEMRMFAFSVCLIGAAVLAYLFGEDSALALVVGAAIGVFGPRAIERFKASRDGDGD